MVATHRSRPSRSAAPPDVILVMKILESFATCGMSVPPAMLKPRPMPPVCKSTPRHMTTETSRLHRSSTQIHLLQSDFFKHVAVVAVDLQRTHHTCMSIKLRSIKRSHSFNNLSKPSFDIKNNLLDAQNLSQNNFVLILENLNTKISQLCRASTTINCELQA